MVTSALALNDIDAFYGDSHVLQKVSFQLGEGRLLGLLGRNGAGKSTCMNVTVGLLPPRAGTVAVFGAAVTRLPPESIAAHGVALVPQGRRMFRNLTVRDEADAPARDDVGGEAGDRLAEQADRALARRQEPHDGRHAGGLARAVAAEQPEEAPRLQRERDLLEHVAVSIEGVDLAQLEGVIRQDRPPGCGDRRPLRRACPRRSPRRNATA